MSDRIEGTFLPGARLIPGPYVADPFPFTAFVMKSDAAAVRALLPPSVTPLPGFAGYWFLTFSAFTGFWSKSPLSDGRRIAYRECAPFLPCRAPGLRHGAFFPEMWLDSVVATLLGREIYGFPKRLAQITAGNRSYALDVDGRRTVDAAWSGEREGKLDELVSTLVASLAPMRRMSCFMHKQILAADSVMEPKYALDQLVEVPFSVHAVSSLRTLVEPRVTLTDFVLPGEVQMAFTMQLSFEFGAGEVIVDYAPKREAAR